MLLKFIRRALLIETPEERALSFAALRAIGGPFVDMSPDLAAERRAWAERQEGAEWRAALKGWIAYYEKQYSEKQAARRVQDRAAQILREKGGSV